VGASTGLLTGIRFAGVLPWHHASAHPAPALIALLIGVPALAALGTALVVAGLRTLRQRRRGGPGQLRAASAYEERARARMSELCPHGWRAQVTVFGPGDELPPDAPRDERARVALDWAELEDDSGQVAIVRRVWAATVAEALDAMVADRRTDETLEEIERHAPAWPD
jgi:hypothetical protein